MSWFTTTHQERISSTIPTDVVPSDIITYIHNLSNLINLNPLVTSHQTIPLSQSPFLASETSSSDAKAYLVTSSHPLGSTRSTTSFVKTEDGVDSVTHVGGVMGLKMWVRMRVVRLPENSNWWVLQEDCTMEGNWLVMPWAAWGFRVEHEAMHERLLTVLANSSRKD